MKHQTSLRKKMLIWRSVMKRHSYVSWSKDFLISSKYARRLPMKLHTCKETQAEKNIKIRRLELKANKGIEKQKPSRSPIKPSWPPGIPPFSLPKHIALKTTDLVLTRSSFHNICDNLAFLSHIKPKNFKKA